MYQVFISYPRDQARGQAIAKELYSLLKQRQIAAFFDEDGIASGERWLEVLKTAIAESKFMLWVVSAASQDRKWQEREFNEAECQQVTVIPILAEDVPIPMQVNDVQAHFLFGERKASELEKLLAYLDQRLGLDQLNPLIKAALKAKHNEAYPEAMQMWQRVLALAPQHARAQNELEELSNIIQQRQQAQAYLLQLVPRMTEISAIFIELARVLSEAGKHPYSQTLLEATQAFLAKQWTAADYIQFCQTLLMQNKLASNYTNPTNYAAFVQRVVRGEIVLFIGSDLHQSHLIRDERTLALELANQIGFNNFNGGFSTIAEYFRLNKDYGEGHILTALREYLIDTQSEVYLFHLLAKIHEPLILISSAYDDVLECSFDKAGKRYIELTSLVNRYDQYDIGHLVVRYSDRAKPEIYRPIEEEISRFRWYEEGYSLIFKIRGTCSSSKAEHEYQRESLTVTESDYFTFARYAEKMIPSYLAKHFKHKGFLFLGFSPKSWEERLLVNALLERRKNVYPKDPAYTVSTCQDPLEAAYWLGQQVQQHDMDLRKLAEYLEEALL